MTYNIKIQESHRVQKGNGHGKEYNASLMYRSKFQQPKLGIQNLLIKITASILIIDGTLFY